jgi:RNA methyltransferase, TrmH family
LGGELTVIRDIAGRQNHSVKLARKLQKKKHRRERGLLVGEGMDLLRAAVEAGADVREVLVRTDLAGGLPAGMTDTDIGICDVETLEFASSLGGGVDVVFMCAEPNWSLADLPLEDRLTFFLDGIGDPGNVGTVIRSAVAFGAGGVICSPGTADPLGPKAMRAGMGAQFSLPVVTEVLPRDLWARFAALTQSGGEAPEVWVADPHEGDSLRSLQAKAGVVVVLGAERTGPGSDWLGARRVSIPQQRFDSLNVAMAATIFAYELSRAPDPGRGGK